MDLEALHQIAEQNQEAVKWLTRCAVAIALLVVVQMLLAAVLYAKTVWVLRRVEALLTLTEQHGSLNDAAKADIKRNTVNAVKGVAALLTNKVDEIKKEVPVAVVQAVAQQAPASGGT